jgi:hypothetical protein
MSDEDLGRAVGALERRPGRQAYRPRRWPHILVRPGYAPYRGVCEPIRAPRYSNPVSGAVSGEVAGAANGNATGGPVGALIGGAVGTATGTIAGTANMLMGR